MPNKSARQEDLEAVADMFIATVDLDQASHWDRGRLLLWAAHFRAARGRVAAKVGYREIQPGEDIEAAFGRKAGR